MDDAAECFVGYGFSFSSLISTHLPFSFPPPIPFLKFLSPSHHFLSSPSPLFSSLQEKILEQMHQNLTGMVDPDTCDKKHCIPHQKFAMTVMENVSSSCMWAGGGARDPGRCRGQRGGAVGGAKRGAGQEEGSRGQGR